MTQKEIKLSNRNQTILTGVRLNSDPSVLIDFSDINLLKSMNEPMEIAIFKEDMINTKIMSSLKNHSDVEMRNVDGRSGAARPTTLNLTGPFFILFFFSYFFFLCRIWHIF